MEKKKRNQRGVSTIEMLLIFIPVLIFLMTIFSLYNHFQQRYELVDAINDGLEYATTLAVTYDQVSSTCSSNCHKDNVKKAIEDAVLRTYLSGLIQTIAVEVVMPAEYKRGAMIITNVTVNTGGLFGWVGFDFVFSQSEIIQQDPTS